MFRMAIGTDNCIDATSRILEKLQVKATRSGLRKSLIEHPYYPSLLSISDVLTDLHVSNIVFTTTPDKLTELGSPVIAHLKTEEGGSEQFVVLEPIDKDRFNYYNTQKNEWAVIEKQQLQNDWSSGIVLFPQAKSQSGEKEFHARRKKEKARLLINLVAIMALPCVVILKTLAAFFQYGEAALMPALFLFEYLAGAVFTAVLIWYEVDRHNPVVRQLCKPGASINCDAVLHAKGAAIMGISWSSIGFVYFVSGLLMLLVQPLVSINHLVWLSWVNLLALPYVGYSLYYQWKIVGQWCKFCLMVQALLIIQAATAFAAGWHYPSSVPGILSSSFILPLVILYLLPVLGLKVFIPEYKMAKTVRDMQLAWQRLKYDPEVFATLLAKQKAVQQNTAGLGIVLGNPQAAHTIIKVCNPYCGPCGMAHEALESLLENNDNVQVQIIFTATPHENDIKAAPVKHFLAIAEKRDPDLLKAALNDWYLAENRDYALFADKYPMNGELKKQDDKINAMHQWCQYTGITYTPTIFINGNELPDSYSANDLKHFVE